MALVAPLERDRELAVVEAAAQAAVDGRGSVVLVEGPAGIGKSRLLDEARHRAAGQLTPLSARGSSLERDFGFGVVRQLLEVPAQARDVPEAARAVLGAHEADAAADFAALHGLLWTVLDLAAERPLLLAVDDLQRADRPSLRFLAYLARRVEEVSVLVLATVRTGDADVDEDLLAAIREAPTRVISPGPLSAEATAAIVSERLGAEAAAPFVHACHEATRGNPLLVHELVGALAADGVRPAAERAGAVRAIGPRAVSRTVALRLARLPADAVATAQAVAVLGDGAAVSDVARLVGLDEERVAAATGPLARSDLLRPEPPLAFVHPLVADAVLADLPPGERQLQHRRAAVLLREAGAPAEQVAAHLARTARAGESWVVEVLRDAAGTALRRGAPEAAVVLLGRALDEPPPPAVRGDLLLELGLAEAVISGTQAVEHLRGALTALVDPPRRALAAAALGRSLQFGADDAAAGAEVARRVAAELGPEHSDLRDQLLAFALNAVHFGSEPLERLEATIGLRDAPRRTDDGAGPRMVASATALVWAYEPGDRHSVAELARYALADGHVVRADNGLMNIPAIVVLALAEDDEAIIHLDEALADAYRRGSLFAVYAAELWQAGVRLWRGEVEEAEAMCRRCLETARLWGATAAGFQYLAGFWAAALVERGDVTGARTALGLVDEPSAALEGGRHWHEAHLRLLLAEGDDAAATGAAELLASRYAHVRNPATARWRSARAVLRHRAGDLVGATDDLEAALALARRWGTPGPIGRVLRVRGELLGDPADLQEAVRLTAASTDRLEQVCALLALGRRMRLDRRPTEAREPLRRALEVAAASGARRLADEVRQELAAAGLRPRTEALSGPKALTPSERRVAELAAEGHTNRDIAQRLFVTPKTIEVHLSAVYRKLDIQSRRGLPAALVA